MHLRPLPLVIALAALLPLRAEAQHMSLGAGLGTDGVTVELNTSIGRYVHLRAGYGKAFGIINGTISKISVPLHPGNPDWGSVTVPLKLRLGMNEGHLLFNIHPGDCAFHFTVGTYFGNAGCLSGELSYLPADYNTVGIDVDGYLVKAQDGVMKGAIYAPGFGKGAFAVKPYFGIGFGRAVRADRRMSFSIDLGAQYLGKPSLWGLGEGLTGRTKMVPLPEDAMGDFSEKTRQFTRYLVVWPTISAHFYVRLF